MLGTIVNALAIIGGSLLGLLFSKGIADNYKEIILSGVGLSVVLIGVKSALVSDNLMVVIFSVILGALLGESLKIEKRLENLGAFLERKVVAKSDDSKSFARGFVTASLVFCVGDGPGSDVFGCCRVYLPGHYHHNGSFHEEPPRTRNDSTDDLRRWLAHHGYRL
jgi:uncharacterized membrane protein YqgA involved in biofilm formation